MSRYAEIIKRLEKATGGDRELDARIWAALAGVKYQRHNKPYADQLGRTQVEYTEPPKRTRMVTNPPHMPHAEPVSSSIDAAIALVERMLPGWGGLLSIGSGNSIHVADLWSEARGNQNSEDEEETPLVGEDAQAEHASLPIAILLALFRALEAKEGG